jgi:hypothetical protein
MPIRIAVPYPFLTPIIRPKSTKAAAKTAFAANLAKGLMGFLGGQWADITTSKRRSQIGVR